MFSWQPTLVGGLVSLKPLVHSDFERLYQAASDPRIWELHPQPTRYQREVFQAYFDSAILSQGALLVLDAKAGEVLGCSRFYQHEGDSVYIGFTFLICRVWGGAHNREMKHLMLSYAFDKVNQVLFEVGSKNFRSQRAMEKIGGRLISQDGKHIYRIMKSDYVSLI